MGRVEDERCGLEATQSHEYGTLVAGIPILAEVEPCLGNKTYREVTGLKISEVESYGFEKT